MLINTYVAGPIDANNYLVYDEKSKEAVLIDCSDYIAELVDFVDKNGLTVKYILLTHGHFDHILGVNSMKEALRAKVFIHGSDLSMVENLGFQMQMFGFPAQNDAPQIDDTLQNAGELRIGGNKIEVIETAGHTSGSVSYKIGDVLFSGDTLFRESIGRTDLPQGNFRDIIHSVKEVLFALDDNVKVYTGHGEPTTIGYEKKFNEILRY